MSKQEFDVVRPKCFPNFFQFLKCKLSNYFTVENKKQSKSGYLHIQIESGSDGCLMSIRMYKMLIPHTVLSKLNKFIDIKYSCTHILTHAYKNGHMECVINNTGVEH